VRDRLELEIEFTCKKSAYKSGNHTGYDNPMIVAMVPFLLMAQAQDGFTYRVYEADKILPATYQARRTEFLSKMQPGSIAVLVTNPMHQRSNDTDYKFRPNSYFWYLTGCEEQGSALILSPDGITVDGKRCKEILFVKSKNPQGETWTGVLMGPTVAKELLKVETTLTSTRFEEVLNASNAKSGALIERPQGLRGSVKGFVDSYDGWATGKTKVDYVKYLDVMRSIKSPEEIALTWKSMNATVAAHQEALKSCEPNMREYEIQALVEYIFARNGCESVAYDSIVGSGVNSCILHYVESRKKILQGDFLCMDVGAEYHGYASDVTRSYPANGKFSPEQKEIYEIVEAAQEAGVKASINGAPFNSADKIARKIVGEGLVKLGIVKDIREASRYFMHGTSHYVGLDVHDTGDYGPLRSNQIITVEPGIYIKEGSPCDKKWWNIGVRIEDTILITDGAPINMSGQKLPRSVTEIEKLMAQKGLGNQTVGKLISANYVADHSSNLARAK
jgi:Xaa-Pro aminopeptidase